MLIPVWPRLQDPRRSLHEVFRSSRTGCSSGRPLLWWPAQAPGPRAVPWRLCFNEVAVFRMVPGKLETPLFSPIKCFYFPKKYIFVKILIFFFLFLKATDFVLFLISVLGVAEAGRRLESPTVSMALATALMTDSVTCCRGWCLGIAMSFLVPAGLLVSGVR